ncbi:MAG: Ribosomal small subunit Rsm22, partial [Myxococcales bacterium]|nr:Ribosomal small subunit Rsm22 [Myxococcales bacterium]
MTWVIPADLEEAMYAAARAVVGDERLATSALTRAVVDRSKRYTSDRDRLAAPADPRADLAARAAFFTIADAIKIAIPLGELAGRDALPARRPLRIVDLGAGCGAMSLGAIASIDAAIEVVAIDRDVEALRIADLALRDFASRRGAAVSVTTQANDVASASIPRADLVVLGTVLNELPAAQRLPLVLRALAAIEGDGAVIIIEPALRETSRALHELRDAVLAGSHAT